MRVTQENGNYVWTEKNGNMDHFKYCVLRKLLLSKNIHIYALVDSIEFNNGELFWIGLSKITSAINRNSSFILDISLSGCKSILTVDVGACRFTVACYNDHGYDVVNAVNTILETD